MSLSSPMNATHRTSPSHRTWPGFHSHDTAWLRRALRDFRHNPDSFEEKSSDHSSKNSKRYGFERSSARSDLSNATGSTPRALAAWPTRAIVSWSLDELIDDASRQFSAFWRSKSATSEALISGVVVDNARSGLS